MITDATNYALGVLPTGWTSAGPGSATYVLTFDAAPNCGSGIAATVLPQDPTITQSVCQNGAATAPTISAATGPAGLTYQIIPAGGYVAGGTATVTATLTDPAVYSFGAPPPVWTVGVSGTSATYPVTFTAAPTCSEILAEQIGTSGATGSTPLATTGASAARLVAIGGLLLLCGVALLGSPALGRRPRSCE